MFSGQWWVCHYPLPQPQGGNERKKPESNAFPVGVIDARKTSSVPRWVMLLAAAAACCCSFSLPSEERKQETQVERKGKTINWLEIVSILFSFQKFSLFFLFSFFFPFALWKILPPNHSTVVEKRRRKGTRERRGRREKIRDWKSEGAQEDEERGREGKKGGAESMTQ